MGAPRPRPARLMLQPDPSHPLLPVQRASGSRSGSGLVAKMVTVDPLLWFFESVRFGPPPLPPPQDVEIQKAATILFLVITLDVLFGTCPFSLQVTPLPKLILTCSRIGWVLSENCCILRPQVCTLQLTWVPALQHAHVCFVHSQCRHF